MIVQDEAMKYVMEYEIKEGRKPKNVSKTRCGFDIHSSGRDIEVKGLGGTNPFILFNQYNFKALQISENFYLYVVYNIKKEPKLIIFTKNEVIRKAKFYYQWEIPLRKVDFDRGV